MKHVVIDLEFSDVVDKTIRKTLEHTNKEIVQIGAVMLNDAVEIIDEFVCYVRPAYGPVSKNCTRITGITNEDVKNAKLLEDCVRDFVAWIGNERSDTYIYAWSGTDYQQLHGEMLQKHIYIEEMDDLFLRWNDFQKQFEELLEYPWQLSLKHAVSALDLKFEGTQHSALDDARNTAKIFALSKDEKEFKKRTDAIREVIVPTPDEVPVGDIFKKAFYGQG